MNPPRILYLYPEEWTGRRAREVHTLQTCLALAEAGLPVTLVTAGGLELAHALGALGLTAAPEGFSVANLSRSPGPIPIRSSVIFNWNFRRWLRGQPGFDLSYIIHLKAAPMLASENIPYVWEAHEIFAETPPAGTPAEKEIHTAEQIVLQQARRLVATSQALAEALNARYFSVSPREFAIVPHGCAPPMIESVADPRGPLVYAGSIADWKGLPIALEAAARAEIPMRLVGGSLEEWSRLSAQLPRGTIANVKWIPRVTPGRLIDSLRGTRAGLCPTLSETGSGRYSLPMKIFDYARGGLPVIATDLASLRGLSIQAWCHTVAGKDASSWTSAMQSPLGEGEAARDWAVEHTWRKRGERLRDLLVRSST